MTDGATMTLDARPFAAAVKALRKANQKIMPGQIGRAILLEWLRKIILRWPVKTGRSRAGWSAGAKFVGIRIPKGTGAREEGSGRFVKSNEQALMEGAAKSGLRITGGDDGHIVFEVINAVEYAEALESGHSAQAPLGAVHISKVELEQGRVPQQVLDAYEHLWNYLGVNPGAVEIRASDVLAALKKSGAPTNG